MVTVLRHFASFAENLLDKMLLWSGLFKTDRVSSTVRNKWLL